MSHDFPVRLWPVAEVLIPEARQRTKAEADASLVASIERDGLINPILIHQDGTLVAGERRLDAHRKLQLPNIRVTIMEQLPADTAFRLELVENLARKQLPWQDEVAALAAYHKLRMETVGPAWTQKGTANDLGVGDSKISEALQIAAQLDDADVRACPTQTGALNLIRGRAERALIAAKSRGLVVSASVMESLVPSLPANATKEERTKAMLDSIDLGEDIEQVVSEADKIDQLLEAGAEAMALLNADHAASAVNDLVINADFLEWASEYTGPKFDVLHIDFPYGKGYSGSNTRRTGSAHINPTYLDDPDIYFQLVDGLMAVQDNVAFPAAHCIFWFDMQYYQWTVDRFTASGWSLVQPYPLLWTKGYTGVAADTRRRPRHCYETALMFARGDRKISKLQNDHVECALEDTKLHISQKPVAMLKHFLQLVVDEHTAILDPTCGSGSALAAAIQLKAARVLGIELDANNAEVARFLIQRKGQADAA
jgi:hypothetical protein